MIHYSAIYIDDESYAIRDFLLQTKPLKKLTILRTFQHVKDAMIFLNDQRMVDIIFCDIDMPDINGLEAAAIMQPYCKYFVCVTGYPQYALKAYEEPISAYLMKPVSLNKLKKKMKQWTLDLLKGKAPGHEFDGLLMVGSDKSFDCADLNQVLKIVYEDGYAVMYKDDESKIVMGRSLTEVTKIAEINGRFIQVNQEVLLPVNRIVKISSNLVRCTDDIEYKVGKNFKLKIQAFALRHRAT